MEHGIEDHRHLLSHLQECSDDWGKGGLRSRGGAHCGHVGLQAVRRKVHDEPLQDPEPLLVMRLAGHQLLEDSEHPLRPWKRSHALPNYMTNMLFVVKKTWQM